MRTHDAANILVALAQLQRRKDDEYNGSWTKFGAQMAALFPEGLKLETAEDFGRFALLNWILSKISRYAGNFKNGHPDSLGDAAIYCAMLQALDDDHRDRSE